MTGATISECPGTSTTANRTLLKKKQILDNQCPHFAHDDDDDDDDVTTATTATIKMAEKTAICFGIKSQICYLQNLQ
jgi:hypothetical protein